MADELVTELIEAKFDAHEATHPHTSHELCQAQIDELRRRVEELEGGMHKHVATDDFDIEEADE